MLEILIILLIFDAVISIAYENFKKKVSCERKLLKENQKLSDFGETAKRDLEELNAEILQFESRYSDNSKKLYTYAKATKANIQKVKETASNLSEICDNFFKSGSVFMKQRYTKYFEEAFELKNHINKQLDLYNKFLEQTESEVEKI